MILWYIWNEELDISSQTYFTAPRTVVLTLFGQDVLDVDVPGVEV